MEEVEGQKGAVIQGRVTLPQRSGLEARRLRLLDKRSAQLCIVFYLKAGLRRAEGGHAAGRARAGGDVEVVGVHNGMGRGDHQDLWLPIRHLFGGGAVGIDGGLDLPLLAPADSGDDEGRVGDDDGSNHWHRDRSFSNIATSEMASQNHDQRACADEEAPDDRLGCEFLVEEHRRHH